MTYEDMYNALPTIQQADAYFVNRDAILGKIAPLLSKFQYQFGVCLVHAHCKVEPGEKMIATGNVCQPEDAASFPSYHAERWLSTGEPYEFTTSPTFDPPKELISKFQEIVRDGVLGLYFVGTAPKGSTLERTEGRRNITEPYSASGKVKDPNLSIIQTAWLPRMVPDGVIPGCVGECVHCGHCYHCAHDECQ